MTNKTDIQKKVFLRTFGWPYVQVPHDDIEDFENIK